MKLGDLFPYWEHIRETFKDALLYIDNATLEASPVSEVGSIGSILRNLVYTEDYWIQQVVLGEGSVREEDYGPDELPTVHVIIERMDASMDRTEKLLAGRGASELERLYMTPGGETMSLLSILWIVFSNEIHSRGQVAMLMRWLGLTPLEI